MCSGVAMTLIASMFSVSPFSLYEAASKCFFDFRPLQIRCWSFAKIGSVFDRDPRTAKQAVESYAARKQGGCSGQQLASHK